ncbi:Polyferredoxin protein MvhB [Candidatus Methanobinarius endosymbioticus]|uniref:Polyferredoxin protein MvhB n=1 Tax=Candidatus Methanobinarius endosymbioticus TaxID=2006182 RepID=A0A366M9X8_9EURY|nr:Polyferredoxin protein MvhB [Candidatus Methanobinarius endosymbioticus]
MFLSTNKCEGIGECIKICPTEAIRLINGKAFSCITCGACFEACPNHAIFKNRYGGYVVDRAKCNGCGVCEFTCPVDIIHIENGVTKGICARCGICVDACPINSRVDGFDLIEEKQVNFLKSLNLAIPTLKKEKPERSEVKRNCIGTDYDKCILCGRCEYYCPTKAIDVTVDQTGVCTECRLCVDVCPADAIDGYVVDHDKCVLCLNCLKSCPNNAIESNNFEVNIIKSQEPIKGAIVSCLNCGLCADNSETGALKQINGKMRYAPSLDFKRALNELDKDDFDNEILDDILDDAFNSNNDDMTLAKELIKVDTQIEKVNQKSIQNCPVSTLNENINDGFGLSGYCVSCGKCVKVCDKQNARSFVGVEWNGSVSDECISCGICSELCPKDAITLKRGTIKVDTDKCILCETCGVHCPVDAILKTTLAKKRISDGFNLIDNKLCMNCKLCYRICPENAIIDKEELDIMVVDDNKCIYCGACKNACPTKAFIFERKFEDIDDYIDSS